MKIAVARFQAVRGRDLSLGCCGMWVFDHGQQERLALHFGIALVLNTGRCNILASLYYTLQRPVSLSGQVCSSRRGEDSESGQVSSSHMRRLLSEEDRGGQRASAGRGGLVIATLGTGAWHHALM